MSQIERVTETSSLTGLLEVEGLQEVAKKLSSFVSSALQLYPHWLKPSSVEDVVVERYDHVGSIIARNLFQQPLAELVHRESKLDDFMLASEDVDADPRNNYKYVVLGLADETQYINGRNLDFISDTHPVSYGLARIYRDAGNLAPYMTLNMYGDPVSKKTEGETNPHKDNSPVALLLGTGDGFTRIRHSGCTKQDYEVIGPDHSTDLEVGPYDVLGLHGGSHDHQGFGRATSVHTMRRTVLLSSRRQIDQ